MLNMHLTVSKVLNIYPMNTLWTWSRSAVAEITWTTALACIWSVYSQGRKVVRSSLHSVDVTGPMRENSITTVFPSTWDWSKPFKKLTEQSPFNPISIGAKRCCYLNHLFNTIWLRIEFSLDINRLSLPSRMRLVSCASWNSWLERPPRAVITRVRGIVRSPGTPSNVMLPEEPIPQQTKGIALHVDIHTLYIFLFLSG